MKLSELITCRLESGRVLSRGELEGWARAAADLEGAAERLAQLDEWARTQGNVGIVEIEADGEKVIALNTGARWAMGANLPDAIDRAREEADDA